MRLGPKRGKRAAPKSGRSIGRILTVAIAAFLVFGVGMVATAGALFLVGHRSIETVDVDGVREQVATPTSATEEQDDAIEVEELSDVLHVLVVGSDRRDNLTPEQQRELGTGDDDGNRTDTIMLVRIDPADDEVQILSFPRDLLVTTCSGAQDKINAAYVIGENTGVGGPSCVVQTITEVSGLPVDHYVEVDFAGFLNIVDLVDGVPVYLEHPIDDWRAKLDLPAGCQRLSGVEALGFVRTRKYDNDYGRIARQQRFVKSLTDELASVSNVINVPRMFSLVETGASAVTTDSGLSLDKMRRMAYSLQGLAGDRVVSRTVPGDVQIINGIYYEIMNEPVAEQMFAAFEAGTLSDIDQVRREEGDEPTVTVEDVPSFAVLNTSDIGGLAWDVRTALVNEGFSVTVTDNATEVVRGSGEVRHPPHLEAEATLLASYMPNVEAFPIDGLTEIEVLISERFDPMRITAPAEDAGEEPLDAERIGDPAEDDPPGSDLPPDVAEGDTSGAEPASQATDVTAPPPSGREFVGAQIPPPACGF